MLPITRAAHTKSRSRRLSTSPRISRAGTSHEKNPSRRLSSSTVALNFVASTSTMNRNGIEYTMSTKRIITPSSRRPERPEMAPYSVPMTIEITAAKKPMASAVRPPAMIRPSSSNPCSSVPRGPAVPPSGLAAPGARLAFRGWVRV